MNKEQAIYFAYCEVVPYTKESVKVQVEKDKDEFGEFVRVHWKSKKSSKIRYEES